jgi:hypothetical protein
MLFGITQIIMVQYYSLNFLNLLDVANAESIRGVAQS